MLSTVEITAGGSVGIETFDLLINETIVASFQLTGSEFQTFSFETLELVRASDVQVAFTNDLFDPVNNIDRNLIVDKIAIDGVEFETEDPSTFSTGSYSNGGFFPGNLQTEYLHGNGYFQYFQETTNTIEVIAAGSTGAEEFLVEVNGEVLGSFAVSTEFETFVIETAFDIDPNLDVIRVAFTNDLFVPGQIDRDLFVDKVQINGVAFESEADTTYSTGTWVGEGIPHEGFLNSSTLHVTGYFEYQAATNVVVRASGDEGSERIRLKIDGATVATFDLTSEFDEFDYHTLPNWILHRFVSSFLKMCTIREMALIKMPISTGSKLIVRDSKQNQLKHSLMQPIPVKGWRRDLGAARHCIPMDSFSLE